jgi:hypothetical protein
MRCRTWSSLAVCEIDPAIDQQVRPGAAEWGRSCMRLAAEYLEQARHFECIARQEEDLRLRRGLQEQADAYRKLAEARARQLGMPLPTQAAVVAAAVDEFA